MVGPLFSLGQLVATPGSLDAFAEAGDNPASFVRRHITGDWGDLDADDKRANATALKEDLRILSAYHLSNGTKIYIITEADRSATTILLPDEY
jgi:hypothetical protein